MVLIILGGPHSHTDRQTYIHTLTHSYIHTHTYTHTVTHSHMHSLTHTGTHTNTCEKRTPSEESNSNIRRGRASVIKIPYIHLRIVQEQI